MKIKAVATCTCNPWFLVLECPKCLSYGFFLFGFGGGFGGFLIFLIGWIFFERILKLFEALFFLLIIICFCGRGGAELC